MFDIFIYQNQYYAPYEIKNYHVAMGRSREIYNINWQKDRCLWVNRYQYNIIIKCIKSVNIY